MKKINFKSSFSFVIKSLFKYAIFLILPLMYLFTLDINIADEFSIEAAEIILVMLPMIFTVITIALSLPSEKIYGVSAMKFRRIRSGINFSFLEMILVTVIIFALYTTFKIFKCLMLIWTLDFVAVFYSVWFIIQEVPILTHNNNCIIKTIKNAWLSNNAKTLKFGNNSIGVDLNGIVQKIVLQNGIVFAYNTFKISKKDDANLLDILLSKNNEYLFECADNIEFFAEGIVDSYKDINIINAIEMSFDNLEKVLSFDKSFNVVKIYNDSKHYYQATRLIFNLHKITSKLNLSTKFNDKMQKLLRLVFAHINYANPSKEEKEFIYPFLNAILTISISTDEIWFARLIRDSNFNARFLMGDGVAYFYFMSIYFYFINSHNKRATNSIKEQITNFLTEETDGLNADGSTWLTIIQHDMQFLDINKFIQILPELLIIFGDNGYFSNWYQPKHCVSWSSSDGLFSEELIINAWLEVILCNYASYSYIENTLDNVINSLPASLQKQVAIELNTRWFSDNEFVGIDKTNSFLSFYKIDNEFIVCKESNIVKELSTLKNSILFKIKEDEIKDNKKSDRDLEEYKTQLFNGFNAAVKDLPILDTTISLDDESAVCYGSLFDVRGADEIIKNYSKQYSQGFYRLIHDKLTDFETNSINVSNTNKQELLKELSNFTHKLGNEYQLYRIKLEEKEWGLLNSLKRIELSSPNLLLLKENSIKINIVLDTEKSFVRKLNSNEINSLIDRDYKIVNGLYRYADSQNDSSSVFISREEVYKLIQEKYFYASIVFKYKFYVDKNTVLKVFVNKEN